MRLQMFVGEYGRLMTIEMGLALGLDSTCVDADGVWCSFQFSFEFTKLTLKYYNR
jgi:hypothetical protein